MTEKPVYTFRLYIAGNTQNSARAVANLGMICKVYLPDRNEIEIVDVFQEPNRALAEGILMTPTLLKLSPSPAKRILGTLGQTEIVLQALEIEIVLDPAHGIPESEKPTLKSGAAALSQEYALPWKPPGKASQPILEELRAEPCSVSEIGINFLTYATRNGTYAFCVKYGYQYLPRAIKEFRQDPKYAILVEPLEILLKLFNSWAPGDDMQDPRVEKASSSVDERLRGIGSTHKFQ